MGRIVIPLFAVCKWLDFDFYGFIWTLLWHLYERKCFSRSYTSALVLKELKSQLQIGRTFLNNVRESRKLRSEDNPSKMAGFPTFLLVIVLASSHLRGCGSIFSWTCVSRTGLMAFFNNNLVPSSFDTRKEFWSSEERDSRSLKISITVGNIMSESIAKLLICELEI